MTKTRPNYDGARTERDNETMFFHEWGGDKSLSAGIVSAVAELTGSDPVDVERLYDRVDPDSLDAIFEPPNSRSHRNAGRVSFRLGSHTVTVHASGFVVLTEST